MKSYIITYITTSTALLTVLHQINILLIYWQYIDNILIIYWYIHPSFEILILGPLRNFCINSTKFRINYWQTVLWSSGSLQSCYACYINRYLIYVSFKLYLGWSKPDSAEKSTSSVENWRKNFSCINIRRIISILYFNYLITII